MFLKKYVTVTLCFAAIVTAAFGSAARESPLGVSKAHVSTAEEVTEATPIAPLSGNCGFPDCNANDVDDTCDIDCWTEGTFCINGIPVGGPCTGSRFPSCGTSEDCNDNGVPDECEGVECCADADCGLWKCYGVITPNRCDFCIE